MKDPTLARRSTILLTLAAYAATTVYLDSIRATAGLPVLWSFIAVQFGALLTFAFCCYYRIRLRHNAWSWLMAIGLPLSRVNNLELIVLPVMAATALAVSRKTAAPIECSEEIEDSFSDCFGDFTRADKEAAELESAVAAQPGSALF